jgi:hypothetical protein
LAADNASGCARSEPYRKISMLEKARLRNVLVRAMEDVLAQHAAVRYVFADCVAICLCVAVCCWDVILMICDATGSHAEFGCASIAAAATTASNTRRTRCTAAYETAALWQIDDPRMGAVC